MSVGRRSCRGRPPRRPPAPALSRCAAVRTATRKFTARRPAGPDDGPRLLPVRVQPGLHRPAAALRGGARRARAPRRGLYGVSCDARLVAGGLQGEARRHDRAALGLRAQGRGLRGLRRAARRRLPAAGARRSSSPDGVVRWSYQAARPGELPGPNLLVRRPRGRVRGDGDAVCRAPADASVADRRWAAGPGMRPTEDARERIRITPRRVALLALTLARAAGACATARADRRADHRRAHSTAGACTSRKQLQAATRSSRNATGAAERPARPAAGDRRHGRGRGTLALTLATASLAGTYGFTGSATRASQLVGDTPVARSRALEVERDPQPASCSVKKPRRDCRGHRCRTEGGARAALHLRGPAREPQRAPAGKTPINGESGGKVPACRVRACQRCTRAAARLRRPRLRAVTHRDRAQARPAGAIALLALGVALAGGAYARDRFEHDGPRLRQAPRRRPYVARKCARGDRRLSWSTSGPAGAPGAKGAQGPQGPAWCRRRDGAAAWDASLR